MDRQKDSENEGAVSHEVRDGILRVSLKGQVALSTATAYALRHQEIWTEHRTILWDLRKFDPTKLSSQDVLNVDQAFDEIMKLRPGGRTAILTSKDLDLVTRLAITLSGQKGARKGIQIEIRSFLKEKDAIDWLQSD